MIVVAGKNNIAVHALEVLVGKLGAENVAVVPNEDDSGVDGHQRSLVKSAKHLNVTVTTLSEVQANKNLLCFIALEYDKLVKPGKFNTERLYNIHFSYLPKYKGMYTSFWPIYHGDNSSGVTLHKIDSGIDTGDIVGQLKFKINSQDRCSDLYENYIKYAIILFDQYVEQLIGTNLIGKSQAKFGSTYYSKNSINYSNVEIGLNVTAWQLQRLVYGYSFRPFQLPVLFGRKITDVTITSEKSSFRPGEILDESEGSMLISTVDYNAVLHFDNLDEIIEKIETAPLQWIKSNIHNIAGINDRNSKGWSLIIVAAYFGRIDVVKYLISLGANVNDTNYKGTTVLMYAKDYSLRSKDVTLFKLLLNHGSDVALKDYSGKQLVDYLNCEERQFLGI